MWQKIKCWLKGHEWDFQRTYGESEDKSTKFEIINYEKLVCKQCGKVKDNGCRYITVLKGK